MTPVPERAPRRRPWAPWFALLIGIAWVVGYDATLDRYRYPWFGDAASYIEMAESLRDTGRPTVSPWALEHPDTDAVPQPLFPPGLAVLIAAFTPLAGDARTAALWPSRIAAALLPLLVLLTFRGFLPDAWLLGAGLWVLLSPGVVTWHPAAYSDVVCLAFAVASLGALVRSEARDARWLAWGGFTAACAYAIRNAALAVIAASVAALAWEWLRTRGHAWRPLLAWGAGAAVPGLALAAYNLATFGALQPYVMPPSARPWPVNLTDWVRAQLQDLHVPKVAVDALPPAAAAAIAVAALAVGAWAWWRTRHDERLHRIVTVFGGYAAAGGALLVISRSRYEWADTIEVRHTLQYSWALALLALFAARSLPVRTRRALGALAAAVLAASLVSALVDLRDVRAKGREAWHLIGHDPAVAAAIRALPPDTFVASNASVLFRIAAGRSVRLREFGGGDAEFGAALNDVRAVAGTRPSAYVLWCHEWTARASACQPVPRRAGPECRRLRGPPQIVALCATEW
jgi:intracellular septation protein A